MKIIMIEFYLVVIVVSCFLSAYFLHDIKLDIHKITTITKIEDQ